MNLTTAPTGGGRRTVRRAAALASTVLLAAGGLAVGATSPASAAPTSFPAINVPAQVGPNGGTVTDLAVPVTGIGGRPGDISVSLTMSHSWVGDLSAQLIAPGGVASAPLFTRAGGGNNLGGTYVFTDDAQGDFDAARAASPATSGVFRASSNGAPVSLDAAFANASSDGTWTIRIIDNVDFDQGTVSSASVSLERAVSAAPSVVVDGGPADGATVTSAPTYTFYVPEQGSTTKECRVDEGAWVDCTSPYTVDISELEDGPHTVDFRARAESGLQGQSVRRSFVLDAVPDEPADTTAPVVTISSGPTDGASVESAPTFTFTSADDDVAGYECSVDGAPFAACTSPVTLGTEPGAHTFAVRATDESGNTGTAVTRSFTQRDLACEEATATLAEAKADLREAKARFARAKETGNKTRIERTRALRNEARAERNEALAQVEQEC